jgi:hypothetical protein
MVPTGSVALSQCIERGGGRSFATQCGRDASKKFIEFNRFNQFDGGLMRLNFGAECVNAVGQAFAHKITLHYHGQKGRSI